VEANPAAVDTASTKSWLTHTALQLRQELVLLIRDAVGQHARAGEACSSAIACLPLSGSAAS
jgi:hypothetical protein